MSSQSQKNQFFKIKTRLRHVPRPLKAFTITKKGRYSPPKKSKNLDFGFPEGRLHQTERAGISPIYIWPYMAILT